MVGQESHLDLIFILARCSCSPHVFLLRQRQPGCSATRTRHPLQGDVDREAQMGKGVGVDMGGNGARVTSGRVGSASIISYIHSDQLAPFGSSGCHG